MNIQAPRRENVLAGIKVIDTDTHFTEPYDLWTKRAPAKFKDRVPQVKMLDGRRVWVIEGDKPIGFGGGTSAIRKDLSKADGMEFTDWPIEDVHPGSYDAKARVKLMDDTGIWAQIVYGNVLGFGGQNTAKIDPQIRNISTQIYNDAMAELQEDSGQRIFPMPLMPWWDVKECVAEAKRCHKMGLRGVNMNSDPQDHGLPDLGQDYWDPFWEVCSDLKMPINFHIGASDLTVDWFGKQPWPSQTDEAKYIIGSSLMFFGNARVIANIITCGMLDRFPDLKFVSAESGVSWVPFLLEAMEYQLVESTPNLRKKELSLTDYFKRNVYACFWFEKRDFVQLARRTGIDNVMFQTDFPHPTCLFPPSESAAQSLAEFTPEECRKVLSENAAGVYSIPI